MAKKNQTDTTLRNDRATAKRFAKVEARVKQLEQFAIQRIENNTTGARTRLREALGIS
jgi:hypothetical protein